MSGTAASMSRRSQMVTGRSRPVTSGHHSSHITHDSDTESHWLLAYGWRYHITLIATPNRLLRAASATPGVVASSTQIASAIPTIYSPFNGAVRTGRDVLKMAVGAIMLGVACVI
jgi:hypothetical protein